MVVGSFVHFYVMYVSLAVLIVLWLFKPRDRISLDGYRPGSCFSLQAFT